MANLDLKFIKRPIRDKDTNTKKLDTLLSSTNEYKFPFTTRTIKEWNAIPQSVALAFYAAQDCLWYITIFFFFYVFKGAEVMQL